MKSKNVTPTKCKCSDRLTCPSIHEHENGGVILIGQHVSRGELVNMEIESVGQGEGAIRLSREFIDAYFMEYAAKKLNEAK
jgi:hypothetical protein